MMEACQNRDTMLAFRIENPGEEGKVVRVEKPKVESGSCLIRVLRAGVCNTDLEILKGYMGFTGTLGHEFVGIVEQCEEDASWVGKRVCGDINVACADCDVCHNVRETDQCCPKYSRNHCPNRTVLGILAKDGTMAEYLTLPLRNLHLVPDDVPDEEAVFAEPLAAACRIPEQNLIQSNDRVAILGDGKLGLMIAECVGRLGLTTKPVLWGKHPHKLQLVQDSGVECHLVNECIDPSEFSGVVKAHHHAYDVVVDATGSPAGLQLAAGLCRPMGTLVLKSTCAAGEQFNAAPFVIDELRVVGSRCGPIDRALEMLQKDQLCVTKYITKTFPLSQADEAMRCAAERSTMKVQIVCNDA